MGQLCHDKPMQSIVRKSGEPVLLPVWRFPEIDGKLCRGAWGFLEVRSKIERQVMAELAENACVPCKGSVPTLKGDDLTRLSRQLGEDWRVLNEHHLEREYKFVNFRKALDFTNKVGELAEQQNHHPDIYLAWGKVKLTLWTHKIDGLTESDFVFAAKVNGL